MVLEVPCLMMIRILFFLLIAGRLAADTYPKNYDIDVKHYAFNLQLSDASDRIEGEATITFRFLKAGIQRVRLDLINKSGDGKGMEVSKVRSLGADLDFNHQDNVLWITLQSPSSQGQETLIVITYGGVPASGLKIGPNKYGDRTFFSDNWPNRARNWLPTVDHPYDKATSEFRVTAPAHYQVVSNGLKLEETSDGSVKTTHWKQGVPISCWLYVLGVARFAIQYVDEFDGKSIQTWVYHQDRDAGFYDFAIPTKHALEFYSDHVGPFVYEKLANIQSNSVGGGMEAASAILYGDNSVTGTRSERWRNVVIHEIAHQWFGNAVTEADWDDVWLSEGFATYFTLLFIEHAYGREAFVKGLMQARDRVFSFYEKNPDYRIVHDNLDDMSKVTTGNTYQKGAWILHMLRIKMGDEAFWEGIREYYATFINGTTNTSEFRSIMEKHHGGSLDTFFSQWLYQGGNLDLEITWEYTDGEIVIDVHNRSSYVFTADLPLKIDGVKHIMPISGKNSNWKMEHTEPSSVSLDPDTELLVSWTIKKKK